MFDIIEAFFLFHKKVVEFAFANSFFYFGIFYIPYEYDMV